MKKLYLIQRQDIFEANLPEGSLVEVGSLWATVRLTDEERKNYKFPIDSL